MDWEGDGECKFLFFPYLMFFFKPSILLQGLETQVSPSQHRGRVR